MGKHEYYTDAWWRLQDAVLREANSICADCGWRAVVAHHKSYAAGIICPPQYLVALCDQCHRARHGLSDWRREHRVGHMRRQGWEPCARDDPDREMTLGGCWKRLREVRQ